MSAFNAHKRSGSPAIDDLLFRWYGLSVCLFTLKVLVSASQVDASSLHWGSAWPLYLFTLCGLSLVYWGVQRWLLLLSGITAARCIASTHITEERLLWFPAAEWALYLGLPLLSWVALYLTQRSDERDPREEQCSPLQLTWRAAFVCSMSFAALHKLNSDFFTHDLSCVRLSERLTSWWQAPMWLYQGISPWMIVAAEGGLSLLLWARPRLGVLISALIFTHFGSIGATGFATLMFGMSLSFLKASDRAMIVEVLSADRRPLITLALLGAGGSYICYQGPYSWPQYGLFHAGASLMIGLMVLTLIHHGMGERATSHGVGRAGVSWALFGVALWSLNGLTPYLGLKFQYSFAMLSNLRVDDSRWNSYLFPRAMRLTSHDDFIFISKVDYRSKLTGQRLRGGSLTPSLVSAKHLRDSLANAERVGEELRVVAQYHGERFDGLARPPEELLTWLEARAMPLFIQDSLPFVGAQRCVH